MVCFFFTVSTQNKIVEMTCTATVRSRNDKKPAAFPTASHSEDQMCEFVANGVSLSNHRAAFPLTSVWIMLMRLEQRVLTQL